MKYLYAKRQLNIAHDHKGNTITFGMIKTANTVFCYGKSTILHFARSLNKANFQLIDDGRLQENQFRVFRNGTQQPISIMCKTGGKLINFFDFTQFLKNESNFLNDIIRFEHILEFFRSKFNINIAENARSLPNLSRRFLESYMEKFGETIKRNHERYDYLNEHNLIRGGACLIPYPDSVGKIIKNVNVYDRKSAYPYEFIISPRVVDETDYEEIDGIHFSNDKISLLCIDGLNGYSNAGRLWNDCITGEPTDEIWDCNVIFTQHEYEIMEHLFNLRVENVKTIQFPKKYLKSFRKFAEDIYTLKENSAGDIRWCMKMLLNTATGALCSRNNPISYINAGLVYGNARAILLEKIASVKDCYYTDTDSIFTTDTMTSGANIGDFELRQENANLCILNKKVYALSDENGKINDIHVAGVSKTNLLFESIEEFAKNPILTYTQEVEMDNYNVAKEVVQRRLTEL